MTQETMTSYQRVMTAMEGGTPDRVPLVPIVREWAVRQAGFEFGEVLDNVEKYVYSQYYCLRHFGYDAVWDLAAIHAESEAMGSVLKVPRDMPPSVLEHVIQDYSRDLPKLRIPDPAKDGRLPLILEGIRRMKELCDGQYPIVGYVQGPFRHSCMLRGTEALMRDLFKQKQPLKELLEIATESLIVYAKAVVEAGADLLCISDPSSSGDAVSPKVWKEFGFPYTKRLVEAVKPTGIKIFLHVCGDTNDRLDSFAQTGVHGLSLDQKVDLAHARRTVGDSLCLIGNVDPSQTLMFGSPEQVGQEAREAINQAGQQGAFILSSGCMMPSLIPGASMTAMVDAAKSAGVYPLN